MTVGLWRWNESVHVKCLTQLPSNLTHCFGEQQLSCNFHTFISSFTNIFKCFVNLSPIHQRLPFSFFQYTFLPHASILHATGLRTWGILSSKSENPSKKEKDSIILDSSLIFLKPNQVRDVDQIDWSTPDQKCRSDWLFRTGNGGCAHKTQETLRSEVVECLMLLNITPWSFWGEKSPSPRPALTNEQCQLLGTVSTESSKCGGEGRGEKRGPITTGAKPHVFVKRGFFLLGECSPTGRPATSCGKAWLPLVFGTVAWIAPWFLWGAR